MSSIRSIDYFREVLNTMLNYFGRKQKKKNMTLSNLSTTDNSGEDLYEIVEIIEEDDQPIIEQKYSLHNSYKLFYKRLPTTVARDANIRQIRVREYYKNSVDKKNETIIHGLLKLNSLNKDFDEKEDFEENFLNSNEIEEDEPFVDTLPSDDEQEELINKFVFFH